MVVCDLCVVFAKVGVGLKVSVECFDETLMLFRALPDSFLLSNDLRGFILLILCPPRLVFDLRLSFEV